MLTIRIDKPIGLKILKKLGEGANATVRLAT